AGAVAHAGRQGARALDAARRQRAGPRARLLAQLLRATRSRGAGRAGLRLHASPAVRGVRSAPGLPPRPARRRPALPAGGKRRRAPALARGAAARVGPLARARSRGAARASPLSAHLPRLRGAAATRPARAPRRLARAAAFPGQPALLGRALLP